MFGTSAMPVWLEASLGVILLSSLGLLAAERLRHSIRLVAAQGAALGLMPLLMDLEATELRLVVITLIFFSIKAVALPYLLRRTHNHLPVEPHPKPYLGYKRAIFAGILGFAFSVWLMHRLPMPENDLFEHIFPTALAAIFSGLLLIVSRRKALNQVMGYLVMENGIYLMGLPLAGHEALWVELSTLLDIFVAVFVMGIAIHRINRAFDSTDVDRLALLRD